MPTVMGRECLRFGLGLVQTSNQNFKHSEGDTISVGYSL